MAGPPRARFLAPALLALVSARALAEDPPWISRGVHDGVAVYSRNLEGSPIKEVKAEATIASPPASVWAVIQDVAAYPKIMPYTQEARILEAEAKTVDVYIRLALPIVKNRDYTVRRTIEHLPSDGGGLYRLSWRAVNDHPKAPPPSPQYLRLTTVSGYYELTPEQGGAATHIVYVVHTDPASPLPGFIVDRANRDAVPKVIKALRDWSKKAPYVDAK